MGTGRADEISPWFQNERFWRECYGFLFPDQAFDDGRKQVGQVQALTGVEGGDALDLCCGPGRHAVPLAQRGFRVTGVDRSPFLLATAGRRASESDVWLTLDSPRSSFTATSTGGPSLRTRFGSSR